MIEKQSNGVEWLEFELLAEFPIIHGCFKRLGGVSSGLFDSLNLGKSVGDLPENIAANYKKATQALSFQQLICAKLCHGADVTAIESPKTENIPLSDALMTSLPGLGIAVTHADCQTAIFYDPVNHAMANVHCGWRGSVQNIYAATVRSMQDTYGSAPSNLIVCISPSLGPEHAEFIHYRKELPECFWPFKIRDCFFDFWEISKWQLETAGVLSRHIQIAGIDTYSHPDFFSHRRTSHEGLGSPCGRQATICALI